MAVRFNPDVSAYLNTEPLSRVDSLDQLETSPLYTFSWNGRPQTVYHTDSFDYVVPVVEDDSPVSVEIRVEKPFQEAVFRHAGAGRRPENPAVHPLYKTGGEAGKGGPPVPGGKHL